MNRREFTAILSGAASFGISINLAHAFKNDRYTCVVDQSVVVPSPILYEVQTCRMLQSLSGRYSDINVITDFGGNEAEIDARRKQIVSDLTEKLSAIETAARKLAGEINSLNKQQAEAQFKLIKSYVSFASTVVVSVTIKDPKLLLIGSAFLTAYAVGDYALQIYFKEDDAIDAISVVTNTRNSLISIIPLVSDYTLEKSFGYYSLINELIMLSAGTWVIYDNYSLNNRKKDTIVKKLELLASKAAELKFFVSRHMANNSDFVSLADRCKKLSIDALSRFYNNSSGTMCRGLPKISAFEFFEHFDGDVRASLRSGTDVIP